MVTVSERKMNELNQWYVYIVKCANGKLYTGITDDVDRRFKEHQRRGSHFTSYNPAIKLLFTEPYDDRHKAALREKQIKGWTRAKKLALAKSDLALLKKL